MNKITKSNEILLNTMISDEIYSYKQRDLFSI